MREELLKTIKSRGYWSINFIPMRDQELKLPTCKEIIEKSSVEFRGWDYPHFPRRRDEDTDLVPGNNHYEGWIDWGAHKEIWRMYQSGQFVHYLALNEDWWGEDSWYGEKLKKIKPKTILSIISATYLLTEIFEFLARLGRNEIYKEGVKINIKLCNTRGRKLEILDFDRGPLFREYKTGIENVEFLKTYSGEEILGNSRNLALDAIIHFFHRFNWDNPPTEVIKSDQEKLINKRL